MSHRRREERLYLTAGGRDDCISPPELIVSLAQAALADKHAIPAGYVAEEASGCAERLTGGSFELAIRYIGCSVHAKAAPVSGKKHHSSIQSSSAFKGAAESGVWVSQQSH